MSGVLFGQGSQVAVFQRTEAFLPDYGGSLFHVVGAENEHAFAL